jgi:hypothetical protein
MDLLGVPATPLLGCTWGLAILAQSCGKRHDMACTEIICTGSRIVRRTRRAT